MSEFSRVPELDGKFTEVRLNNPHREDARSSSPVYSGGFSGLPTPPKHSEPRRISFASRRTDEDLMLNPNDEGVYLSQRDYLN